MFLIDLSILFGISISTLTILCIVLGIVLMPPFYLILLALEKTLLVAQWAGFSVIRFILLVFRSLQRNLLRTALSYMAIYVLVSVVVMIWSVLSFLDGITTEKQEDFKVLITEKFQIPSQMPPSYEQRLLSIIDELPPEYRMKNGEMDVMTWAFVGGTLDPTKQTFENSIFFFCMQSKKFPTMMSGLEEFTPEEMAELNRLIDLMEKDKKKVVIGTGRLEKLQKKVGDRFKMVSLNYKDLEFEFEIVGTFPKGSRYDESAVMHRDYLYDTLRDYEKRTGMPHPMANKCLNLIWVRLPSKEAYSALAAKANESGSFSTPAVKVETESSGVGSFLDAYRDLINGMRYMVVPAILATMALVIANAISITVRERRTEMAVLKVLGFTPGMIMMLVLGEALLIGVLAGGMASSVMCVLTQAQGGVKFPIAFFPAFKVPYEAISWGIAIGAATALAGSLLPALSARRVKVSEVFSRVA